MYSNQPRKPMMYGGMAPKKRQQGTPSGQMGEKETTDDERRKSMMGMSPESLRRIASGDNARDASIAKSILAGPPYNDKGAFPPGDQEPAGKMYGGMAKKKMMYGGKAKKK